MTIFEVKKTKGKIKLRKKNSMIKHWHSKHDLGITLMNLRKNIRMYDWYIWINWRINYYQGHIYIQIYASRGTRSKWFPPLIPPQWERLKLGFSERFEIPHPLHFIFPLWPNNHQSQNLYTNPLTTLPPPIFPSYHTTSKCSSLTTIKKILCLKDLQFSKKTLLLASAACLWGLIIMKMVSRKYRTFILSKIHTPRIQLWSSHGISTMSQSG